MDIKLEAVLIQLIPALEQVIKDLKLKERKRIARQEEEEKFKEAERKYRDRQAATTKAEQDACPHVAGCNSISEGADFSRTSIVWHTTDLGEEVGICTNCLRQFWPEDSDYTQWRKKLSINKQSAAGQRLKFGGVFIPPTEECEKFTQGLQESLYELSEANSGKSEGLEALSDQEIAKLFDGTRKYRKALKKVADEFSGSEWSVG